jgi:hypothetical protein
MYQTFSFSPTSQLSLYNNGRRGIPLDNPIIYPYSSSSPPPPTPSSTTITTANTTTNTTIVPTLIFHLFYLKVSGRTT